LATCFSHRCITRQFDRLLFVCPKGGDTTLELHCLHSAICKFTGRFLVLHPAR